MTRFNLDRLRRLEFAELVWRTREAADIVAGRLQVARGNSSWDRRRLATALGSSPEMRPAIDALRSRDWMAAHRTLARHFAERPARFVIAPILRSTVALDITARFPDAPRQARCTGDRLLDGRYHLLGYRDLPFDGAAWHSDPIHGRTAPRAFWSKVPYLDATCGDHKVVWEINRHQHWMELGRAYWLTGDERYRSECLRQLDTWMQANPPLIGINWASVLELGFRTLSWIWALNYFCTADAERDDSPWLVDLLLGVDRQLIHVERHLSYYFSPNTHLLGEALALYIAGRTLPELAAAPRREETGRRVLVQEIGRQIAADGGHCERSAHYHRYTLDFYLLALAVARLTNDPIAGVFERTCARLAEAARALANSAGRLPHLGDDDGGSLLPLTRRPPDDVRDTLAIAAALTGRTDLIVDDPPEELWWLLGDPCFAEARTRVTRARPATALTSTALPATGYYISRAAGEHLIVDGGPHGYMNAGHAHSDALSMTFSHRGRALLIDTGTYSYTMDRQARDRFRSTALHNTLTIDGRSQSIPRGPFHWAHTTDALTRRWRSHQRFDYFAGEHDGYRPLIHARHVLVMHGDLLLVADLALGSVRQHELAVHWHLDPAWSVALDGPSGVLHAAHDAVSFVVAGGTVESLHGDDLSGLGWHAPVYGLVEPTTTLRIAATAALPHWIVSAFCLDPLNPIQSVAVAPVESAGAGLAYAAAIRLGRQTSVDHVVIAEPQGEPRQVMWRAGDIESDAVMLFTRAAASTLTAVAAVDVTTVRCERQPQVNRMYPSRVGEVFVAVDPSACARPLVSMLEDRKETGCVESLDSLMVPR